MKVVCESPYFPFFPSSREVIEWRSDARCREHVAKIYSRCKIDENLWAGITVISPLAILILGTFVSDKDRMIRGSGIAFSSIMLAVSRERFRNIRIKKKTFSEIMERIRWINDIGLRRIFYCLHVNHATRQLPLSTFPDELKSLFGNCETASIEQINTKIIKAQQTVYNIQAAIPLAIWEIVSGGLTAGYVYSDFDDKSVPERFGYTVLALTVAGIFWFITLLHFTTNDSGHFEYVQQLEKIRLSACIIKPDKKSMVVQMPDEMQTTFMIAENIPSLYD